MATTYVSGIKTKLSTALQAATYSIVIVATRFTDIELFSILIDKLGSGGSMSVMMVIRNGFINNRNWTGLDDPGECGIDLQSFIDAGGKLYFPRVENPPDEMFCIIDGSKVYYGSYEWTYTDDSGNGKSLVESISEYDTETGYRTKFQDSVNASSQGTGTIAKIGISDIVTYDGTGAKSTIAIDIAYQALATDRPELFDTALAIDPGNTTVDSLKNGGQSGVTTYRSVTRAIGIAGKNQDYIICVPAQTTLPAWIKLNVANSINYQANVLAKLFYGPNSTANTNIPLLGTSSNNATNGVLLKGIKPQPEGETLMGLTFVIDSTGFMTVEFFCWDNNVQHDFFSVQLPTTILAT